jgi:type I restriction enzyme, S subunit
MKAYPAYKESGVEWIGDIPNHWEMRKVSRSFNLIGSGTTPKSDNAEYYDAGIIHWVITGDLNDGYLTESSKKITQKAFDEYSTLKMYPEGTLLIAMYGATIGKISLLGFEACTNQACCAIADSPYITNTFAFYWFLANKQNIIGLGYGGGQPNISQDIIRTLRISTPPLPEQRAIADFLDRKTAQIDTLIEKKQRQIELLQEQRTALINQAVTKGLPPSPDRRGAGGEVPMKDSGIEWLGEIPSHWEVAKLKFLGNIRYGLGQPPKELKNGLPIIRATNIERGKIVLKDMFYVDPDDVPENRNPYLAEGEIIVVRSGAYTADSAIITEDYVGAVAGYDMVITPTTIDAELLAYALLSQYVLKNQLYLQRMRAAQPHLNAEELGDTTIVFPSTEEEQKSIVSYLDIATKNIATAKDRMKKQIELLQEYRTALISAAVTGKIDVREWKVVSREW